MSSTKILVSFHVAWRQVSKKERRESRGAKPELGKGDKRCRALPTTYPVSLSMAMAG